MPPAAFLSKQMTAAPIPSRHPTSYERGEEKGPLSSPIIYLTLSSLMMILEFFGPVIAAHAHARLRGYENRQKCCQI